MSGFDAPDELIGPQELAARVGLSVSGLKKLERLGHIPPALRLSGSNHRAWRGEDAEVVRQLVNERRAARGVAA